jgi:hypothetical protein
MEKLTKNKYVLWALIIILVILALLIYSFGNNFRRLYTNGVFGSPESTHRFHLLGRRPATASDVYLISPWMTFNYINKAFNLPPIYLQNALSITDSAYPNVTISKVAASERMLANTFTDTVKTAVSAYLAQPTTTQ